MNRNFSFIFVLLAILSIVNAIPHKRATVFQPCGKVNPLDVTVLPDPPVPGKVAEFTVLGKINPPATPGAILGFAFMDISAEPAKIIGTPKEFDLCSETTCPLSELNAKAPVPVPAALPPQYGILVVVFDAAKNPVNSACGIVGAGGAPAALESSLITSSSLFFK
jgi:hypothetical protein